MHFYVIEYEIAAIFMLGIVSINYFSHRRFPGIKTFFFTLFLILTFADIVMDIASSYVIEYCNVLPRSVTYAVNTAFYSIQLALPALLYLFILSVSDMLSKEYSTVIILVLLPAIIYEIILLLNPVTKWVFYVDSAGYYVRGWFFMYMYACTVYYFAVCMAHCFLFRRFLGKAEYASILNFLLMVSAAIVVQLIYPQLLVVGAMIAVALLIMYLSMQNPGSMLDGATGLMDKTSLGVFLQQYFRKHKRFGLILVSMEQMRTVNSTFGLARGEEIIEDVAMFLKTAAKKDMVFRYIGDQFVIIAPYGDECFALSHTIKERFDREWPVNDAGIIIGCHICFIRNASNISDTLEAYSLLETGIRNTKANGVTIYEVDEGIRGTMLGAVHVERVLTKAIENDELCVYMQPIFSTACRKFLSAEALVRLKDGGALVSPSKFIPIALKNDMNRDITKQVLRHVCCFLADEGKSIFDRVSVNISPSECLNPSMAQELGKIIEDSGIDPARIAFEFTENIATIANKTVLSNMCSLSKLGCGFLLDDFGMGYSNFVNVINLPFDTLKLDMSLLKAAMRDTKSAAVYIEMVKLANAAGLKCVSEGAENVEEAMFLDQTGVDMIQGYYFARPMEMKSVTEYVNGFSLGTVN